jgi:hypothetical protein
MSTPAQLSFAPLSASAREEFADARNFISGVASDLTEGQSLTQTERDVPVLQAIIDHEAMKHANFEAWVALGVAFGDVLVACIPGLVWCMVTDDKGTYAALQFGEKAVSLAAPTSPLNCGW